jgi:macrolide-specific efflux system membrane fusion protein
MKRKTLIGGIFALVVLLGIGIWYWRQYEGKQTYREGNVERGNITVKILATGTVQPENRLEIKSPVAGRVDQVLVSEGMRVKRGQILAWMSSLERAALIDSARAQGADEVKHWEEMYKPTPVVAPIDGMIILKNVENGQTFTTNDAVLVMSNRLTVKAQVDETDLAQIKKGQQAEVRLDSYPDQNIESKVDRIAFEAKTISNVTTYMILLVPEKVPDFMRSGMTANVSFFIENKKDILVVPTEFIKYDNGKPAVLIRTEGEKTELKPIGLGVTDGKLTEIINGLNEGDKVLLAVASPKDKKAINPLSPMGGRPGRKGGGGGH